MKSKRMVTIARYIEEYCDQDLTLKDLALQFKLSPYHLQRIFKAAIGLTPKEFLIHCRMRKLKKDLRTNKSVTEALYDVGFGSSSRLYERLDSMVGMTPKDYKKSGLGLIISWETGKTPLGKVLIAATDRGICFLQFGTGTQTLLEELTNEFPNAKLARMVKTQKPQFEQWMKALSAYLNSEDKLLELPLDIHGTAFQVKVWKYLQKIPYGDTFSYTEVAQAIGSPSSVRAVAGACAKNKIAILIPCHRVLRGNGDLAGYKWGIHRKRKLIELEDNTKD